MASLGSNSSCGDEEGKSCKEHNSPAASSSKLEMVHPEVKHGLPAVVHPKVRFGLPAGYRFLPSDDQMVLDFLLNKIMGYELPIDIINEIDLYAYDPPLLPRSEFTHGDNDEANFFTLIPQAYSITEQTDRAINGGYWRPKGQVKRIYHEEEIVGFKKKFLFYEEQAPTTKESAWVMHEFSVNPRLVGDDEPDLKAKLERYVLCRIKDRRDEIEDE